MTEYHRTQDTERMNRQYPVAETLNLFRIISNHFGVIHKDSLSEWNAGVGMLYDSPAKNAAVETYLGRLVVAAVREGEWVGINTGLSPADLSGFREREAQEKFYIPNRGGKLEFCTGLATAVLTYLLDLEEADGIVYAMPKDGLVRFVTKRCTGLERQVPLP